MLNKAVSISFFMFLFTSCGKQSVYIPDVRVNYRVTMQEFQIKQKNGVLVVDNTGAENAGVGGLLICYNTDGYKAFDRCSTVNPEKNCKVNPDQNGFTAIDPCSGAKFSLVDGSPVLAPGKIALKQYNVAIINNSVIQVSN